MQCIAKVSGTLVLLSLILFTSCQASKAPGNESEKSKDSTASTSVSMYQVSDPDVSIMRIFRNYPRDRIASLLNKTAVIKSVDSESIAFMIGIHTTHAILAVALDDMDSAQAIAEVIKVAAENLNIKSEKIEALLAKTKTDFVIADATQRSVALRADLNKLASEIAEVLHSIENTNLALMVKLGVWSESVSLVSTLFSETYKKEESGLLSRCSDAIYFLNEFALLKNPAPQTPAIISAMGILASAMIPSEDGVAPDKIALIKATVADLQKPFKN